VHHRLLFCASVIALASPALADHSGPGGVGGNAGPLNVIGPETLGRSAAAGGFRLTFAKPEYRSDRELEGLAGENVHAHGSDDTLNAALGLAYGISDRLTVSAELPYVRRDNLREGAHSHVGGVALNQVVGLGSVAGVGDLNLIAKYKVLDDGATAFALLGGVKLPTGSTHRRDNDGERFETEHQPGTGSVDPIGGAAFGTNVGALRFDASALFQIARNGAQHTRLGNRLQGGVALSHRFGPAEHHHDEAEHHHDAGEPHHEHGVAEHGHASWDGFVELTGELEGRQRIAGEIERESGGKSVWLSPGARFTSASGLSAAVAIGVPIWQRIRASHPQNDYRLTLSLGHSF